MFRTKPQGVRCNLQIAAYANEVAVGTVFPALLSIKNIRWKLNREHSAGGTVVGRRMFNGHSYGRAVKMGAVGALCISYRRALHSSDGTGLGRIGFPGGTSAYQLNLELPQTERIRRGNAWSLPKNNYTLSTTLRLGQESGPAGCSAGKGPAVGVKVVGDADV